MKNVVKLLSISLIASCVLFISCKKDVTGVSLSETSLSMDVGDVITLNATVVPDNAGDKAVTWESNNEDVAKVDNNGNVTARGVGKAKITVRTKDGNFTDQCEVIVSPKVAENYNVTLDVSFYNNGNKVTGNITINKVPDPPQGSVPGLVLVAVVENKSGQIIPADTPVKYKVKINGKVVEFQGTDNGLVETKTGEDISSSMVIYATSQQGFPIDPEFMQLGDNSICVELVQVGKSPYSSSRTDCAPFTLNQGESSIGEVVKNGTIRRSLLQLPLFQDVKNNVVIK